MAVPCCNDCCKAMHSLHIPKSVIADRINKKIQKPILFKLLDSVRVFIDIGCLSKEKITYSYNWYAKNTRIKRKFAQDSENYNNSNKRFVR